MTGPVRAQALEDFIVNVFEALAVPEPDARTVAGMMVEAALLGYDTHGVFRLRQYVNRLRDGGRNPTPQVETVTETAATALMDGDNGLGHLALKTARDLMWPPSAAPICCSAPIPLRSPFRAPIPTRSSWTWPPLLPLSARSRSSPSGARRCQRAGWSGGMATPLTDPAKRDEGFLLPIGEPKGYAAGRRVG